MSLLDVQILKILNEYDTLNQLDLFSLDIDRVDYWILEKMPQNFIEALLSELPLKFKISWKDLELDFRSLQLE